MVTGICIVILILSLMQFNFVIRIDSGIDALNNEGYFRIRLFYFTLIVGRVYFKPSVRYGSFVLEWNNKSSELHLNNDINDKQSVTSIFASSFFSAVIISKLATEVRVGKRDDALFTMIALQSARIGISAMLSVLKTRRNVEIYDRFIARYNNDELKIAFSGIIELNFADIIVNAIKKLIQNSQKGGKVVDNRA